MLERQEIENDLQQLRIDLLSDFFLFVRVFFEKKTGREFLVSKPEGNISHFIEIANEFTKVFYLETNSLWLNLPPGWSKSEMCKMFICWCMAHYPDSRFLYISYSYDLASAHTHSIRETMNMPLYRKLFGIKIKRDSSAKDFFQTTEGGAVAAFGSSGAITGRDAGLPGLPRFSGAAIIDDIHKPDEVHSDNIREKVNRNYEETILMRLRGINVPIILIGQRLHEADIFGYLNTGADGRTWRKSIIKALDDAGNARYPEVLPKAQLLTKKEKQPYVFASQYQQDPVPAGGGLFQESWFPLLEETPKIIATFVTCDTAETEKEYNDATVFSFWGVYQLEFNGSTVDDMYCLHWIDCLELRIEPKDLEDHFLDFWSGCMRYHVKPKFAAIEKKSTGVTLISVLKKIQGLRVINIERSGTINSKTNRFLEMQQYIASKQVTLPSYGKHTKICVSHMSKITANNVHRWDDIADTCYDAIKMALIDKIILAKELPATNHSEVARGLAAATNKIDRLRKSAYGA